MNVQRLHEAWARTTPVRVAANQDCYRTASAEADALPSCMGDDLSVAAVDIMGSVEDLWLRLAAKGAIRVLVDAEDRVTVCIAWSEHCHADPQEARATSPRI